MIVNMMRSNQRWLMIIISTLVIISFIYFYSNQTRLDRMGSDTAGKIYGRNLSNTDLERAVRQTRTVRELYLTNLLQSGVGSNPREDVAGAINLFVIQHEAKAFEIEPTEEEIEDAVKKIYIFQAPNGTGYDDTLRIKFTSEKLGPRGFGDRQISDLVRADLQAGRLRQLLESTVTMTPTDVRTAYEQIFTKTEASVIRLKTANFMTGAEPTEVEIKKYYEEQKDHFQHPEKRKVQYVVFGVNDAQKNLTGKELIDAKTPAKAQTEQFLDKLFDSKKQVEEAMKPYDSAKMDAKQYADKLREAQDKFGFPAVAAELKAPIKDTPEFEEVNVGSLQEANIPQFVQDTFQLTSEAPDSDVIDTPTAYYVLHLMSVTPAQPMSLDEARPKIVTAIKEDRARAALTAKAEEIRNNLNASLKAGKSLADAAKEAGQTMQTLPPFSAAEPPMAGGSDASLIAETSLDVNTGELSKFVTASDGGFFVYVNGRGGIDEKKFDEQKMMISDRLKERKRQTVFQDWLRSTVEAANVKLGSPSFSQG